MVNTYLVHSLKRVHDQAVETLKGEDPTSSKVIDERFNQVLENFRTNIQTTSVSGKSAL